MTAFLDIKIGQKLLVAFGLLVLVGAGASALVLRQLAYVEQGMALAAHAQEVLDAAAELRSNILEIRTAARGVMISPQGQNAGSFEKAKQAYQTTLAASRSLTAGEPAQVRRLAEIDEQVATWLVEGAGRQVALVLNDETREEGRRLQMLGTGAKYFNGAIEKAREFIAIEQGLVSVRRQNEASAFNTAARVGIRGYQVV